ncbi:ATP-binding cassette sub-family G member 1-like protein, partial [Dinothrombium tinctorium]
MLDINGKCIYEEDPTNVVQYLSKFGLQCPEFYNPAEFIAEVASGDHGAELLQNLAKTHENQYENYIESYKSKAQKLDKCLASLKCLLVSFRDPWLFGLRLSANIVIGLLIG